MFHEIFETEVVNTFSGQYDIGSRINNFHDPLLRDIHLALPNVIDLFEVRDGHLYPLRHTMALKVHVQHGDPSALYGRRHPLRRPGGVNSKPVHHVGFHRRLPVRLEDVHGRQGIFIPSPPALCRGRHVHHLHGFESVHGQMREEIGLRAKDLGGHRRFRRAEEILLPQFVHLHHKLLLDVGHGGFQRPSVSRHDARGMDSLPNQLVAPSQQLRRHDYDAGGAVTDLLVLEVRELDEHLGGGVLHLQLLENGGTVVGNGHVADVVHEHLIQTHGTQGGFYDVGHGGSRGDVGVADVHARLATSIEKQPGSRT
mmetsp:Transcript_36845/g.86037  ORF Transcript_36845/g.86037 Transcript_36845/m.86037 type:complete len:312 (-) Transcript_36845:113-1048(-)